MVNSRSTRACRNDAIPVALEPNTRCPGAGDDKAFATIVPDSYPNRTVRARLQPIMEILCRSACGVRGSGGGRRARRAVLSRPGGGARVRAPPGWRSAGAALAGLAGAEHLDVMARRLEVRLAGDRAQRPLDGARDDGGDLPARRADEVVVVLTGAERVAVALHVAVQPLEQPRLD